MPQPPPWLADTHELFDSLDSWKLPSADWAAVAELLDHLSEALDTQDQQAAARLTGDLLLYAPRRVSDPDRQAVGEPPPTTVTDRRNHLIHTITTTWPDRLDLPPVAGHLQ